jgi:hypothetical protein
VGTLGSGNHFLETSRSSRRTRSTAAGAGSWCIARARPGRSGRGTPHCRARCGGSGSPC